MEQVVDSKSAEKNSLHAINSKFAEFAINNPNTGLISDLSSYKKCCRKKA